MSDILTEIIVFLSYIYSYCNFDTISFNETYVNVIGFFTFLSSYASALTLLAAAINRFKVVYRPLTFKDNINIAFARKICLGLWLISILLAIASNGIIYENLNYVLVRDIIV